MAESMGYIMSGMGSITYTGSDGLQPSRISFSGNHMMGTGLPFMGIMK